MIRWSSVKGEKGQEAVAKLRCRGCRDVGKAEGNQKGEDETGAKPVLVAALLST